MEWNSELREREVMSQELMSHSPCPERHRSWSRTVAVRSANCGRDCSSKSKLFKLSILTTPHEDNKNFLSQVKGLRNS